MLWLASHPKMINLDDLSYAQIWGLVALGSLALQGRNPQLDIESQGSSSASRFAHAVGLTELISGAKCDVLPEVDRTVRMNQIVEFSLVESTARHIAQLLISGNSDADIATRKVLFYVIVELLRNVIQHSSDRLGAVVAAQFMDAYEYQQRPMIQVCVADAGIGIQHALLDRHPELIDPEEALNKAIWPYFSGTFEEGSTGTIHNAGMGLFFIAEMAKLTAGRLLIASRGATLYLAGDVEGLDKHTIRYLKPKGLGYPGTLVGFELPVNEVQDYDGLIEVIHQRAKQRTPKRIVNRWFRFEVPSADAKRFLVSVASEDTIAAQKFSEDCLQPLLIKRIPISLNFSNMNICTQSFLHALLFDAIRIAWARRTPIFIEQASIGIRSGLELLENYALGG